MYKDCENAIDPLARMTRVLRTQTVFIDESEQRWISDIKVTTNKHKEGASDSTPRMCLRSGAVPRWEAWT